jgi:hypothetical protein
VTTGGTTDGDATVTVGGPAGAVETGRTSGGWGAVTADSGFLATKLSSHVCRNWRCGAGIWIGAGDCSPRALSYSSRSWLMVT